ncbi:MAG: DUF481 domain-containing protein [Saprospiraceae bacterium]|nr:DUF481 domain-containing protein [Saprospiraceae bacterium]
MKLSLLPWILAFGLFCTDLPAQIVNIEEQRITGTSDTVHWYGHLRGSSSFVKVKNQSFQFQSQVKVQYKSDPHMLLLLLNAAWLRAGGTDISRQAFAHLRYNYKLSETWTWEAFSQIQNSPVQLLQQRVLAGTGVRWRALKSKNGRQRIYLGAAWLWEENLFSGDAPSNSWHRSSNYISSTFRAGKHAALIQTTYWQPVIGYIRNYRLSSEWVLKVDLNKHLALTIEFDYSVDQNLPQGAPKEFIAWRNGLAFQF